MFSNIMKSIIIEINNFPRNYLQMTHSTFTGLFMFLSLALSCKRFGDKHGTEKQWAAREGSSMREVRQKIESISLMEVAAHTTLLAKWTDVEKKALPRCRGESWISVYIKSFYLYSAYHYSLINWLGIRLRTSIKKTKHEYFVRRGHQPTLICSNVMGNITSHFNFK